MSNSQVRTTFKRPSQQPGNISIKEQAEKYSHSFVGRSGVEYLDQSLEEVQEHIQGRYIIVFSRASGRGADSEFVETFVPNIKRSIVVSTRTPTPREKRRKSRRNSPDVPDIDEISTDIEDADDDEEDDDDEDKEDEEEYRTVQIPYPTGTIHMTINDDTTVSRRWRSASVSKITSKDRTQESRGGNGNENEKEKYLDEILTQALKATDHHISFGVKYVDHIVTPDFSHDLDSIDEEASMRFSRDYVAPSRTLPRITTNYGFHFVEMSLALKGRPVGDAVGDLKWCVIAVKIEGEDESDEFGGRDVFWSMRGSRIVVGREGRVVGPLLRQEVRGFEDLKRARRRFGAWKRREERKFEGVGMPKLNVKRGKGKERERENLKMRMKVKVKAKRSRDGESERDGTISPVKRSRTN